MSQNLTFNNVDNFHEVNYVAKIKNNSGETIKIKQIEADILNENEKVLESIDALYLQKKILKADEEMYVMGTASSDVDLAIQPIHFELKYHTKKTNEKELKIPHDDFEFVFNDSEHPIYNYLNLSGEIDTTPTKGGEFNLTVALYDKKDEIINVSGFTYENYNSKKTKLNDSGSMYLYGKQKDVDLEKYLITGTLALLDPQGNVIDIVTVTLKNDEMVKFMSMVSLIMPTVHNTIIFKKSKVF